MSTDGNNDTHPGYCGHGWALDMECERCGDDPLPERAVVELRAAKQLLRAIRGETRAAVEGKYGERVSAEGLNRLETLMRDDSPFTQDGAMVAYRLVLDAIADLRELRDIRQSTLAIGRFSGIEDAAKLMEENAECFRRSGQREVAYQLEAEARHIRDLLKESSVKA